MCLPGRDLGHKSGHKSIPVDSDVRVVNNHDHRSQIYKTYKGLPYCVARGDVWVHSKMLGAGGGEGGGSRRHPGQKGHYRTSKDQSGRAVHLLKKTSKGGGTAGEHVQEPVPVDVSDPRVDVSDLRAPVFPALRRKTTVQILILRVFYGCSYRFHLSRDNSRDRCVKGS